MELMQSNAAGMARYSNVIGIPQLRLTLLANIETATKSDYSHNFCSAMHVICNDVLLNQLKQAGIVPKT